ncbi:hypothetical protein [Maribacter sp. 2-571]|uniref:hypothetical protein n=1 Tax=Maribacter sp. 2-571 TaxID=3417569 RepID=UPI003D333FB4
MKVHLLIALTALFLSCSNDKKATEKIKPGSPITSDVLLENQTIKNLGASDKEAFENHRLVISGKTVLEGTAMLKITNFQGEETSCKTFPAKTLIDAEYKTANSVLQEAHIREIVAQYFEDEDQFAVLQ